jgi:hypothetical protein
MAFTKPLADDSHGSCAIAPARCRRDLAGRTNRAYLTVMTRLFDMDDHARLPWRFFGQRLRLAAGA